jgi:hypothetical protein
MKYKNFFGAKIGKILVLVEEAEPENEFHVCRGFLLCKRLSYYSSHGGAAATM